MRLANIEKSDLIDRKGGNMKNLLHKEVEYTSWIPLYITYLTYVNLILTALAILWASYINFIKKKN